MRAVADFGAGETQTAKIVVSGGCVGTGEFAGDSYGLYGEWG